MKLLKIAIVSLMNCASGLALATGSTSSVGPANPASEFCVKSQGTLETLTDISGNEYGICVIDEARISDWTLFLSDLNLREGKPVEKAALAFVEHPPLQNTHVTPGDDHGPIGMPNPASVYCIQVGGTNSALFSPEGERGMCQFDDGSSIDAWTLFLGPDVYPKLYQLLSSRPS